MEEALERLRQWQRGIKINHIGHARTAASFQARNRLLGIAVVILTSVAGTTILGELASDKASIFARVLAGLFSLGATVFAALQTFLNYADAAAKHREAECRYGALRREVEEMLAFSPTDTESLRTTMKSVRSAWSDLKSASPTVPQAIHDTAKQMVMGAAAPTIPTRVETGNVT